MGDLPEQAIQLIGGFNKNRSRGLNISLKRVS